MFDPKMPEVWLSYGDRSYIVTRLLGVVAHCMFDAPVSTHRTIELYLKTYLVSCGEDVKKGEPAWGHNLEDLRNLCVQKDNAFANADLARRVSYFQRYFDIVRYPTAEYKGKASSEVSLWFGFDSAILPLDEIVAFVRPRIRLSKHEWEHSILNAVLIETRDHFSEQRKALKAHNSLLRTILCRETSDPQVSFSKFNFDLETCEWAHE